MAVLCSLLVSPVDSKAARWLGAAISRVSGIMPQSEAPLHQQSLLLLPTW